MSYDVAVIQGDGIGPEVVEATIEVLNSTGLDFKWEYIDIMSLISEDLKKLPDEFLDIIIKNGRAIKGPISTPLGSGYVSPNVLLRQQLGLYASLRPVKSVFKTGSLKPDTNIFVVRETTEDLYVMRENRDGDTASAEKFISKEACIRIARKAFEIAKKENFSSVTALHKADILKRTDGLFLECCRLVAEEKPDIRYSEATIDSACTELILDPTKFEVVVAPNMYGDIFSDVAAGLVGGLGLLGSANVGNGPTVYEAVHGSAPNISGKGIANPSGLITASVMMLRDIGEDMVAQAIEDSLYELVNGSAVLTPDLGGNSKTKEFVEELKRLLQKRL
ncbi:isocitrate/isopropylmalate dehydrogenase family protein [Candidatus Saccharibacteria bacterium]|nr:isocitrate/isopropylmalate dehydrogenase family protein [Candidatus Saccharibacteria bacterium]